MPISQHKNFVIYKGDVYDLYENHSMALVNQNIEKINELEGLENLASLTHLNLSRNNIANISGLEKLDSVEVLDLKYNRITRIEGLFGLVNLRRLILNGNRIEKIEGLEGLKKLEFLELKGNRIKRIEGVKNLGNLKELCLEGNPTKQIEIIESIPNKCRINLGFTPLCRAPRKISLDLAKHISIGQSLIHFYVMETLKLNPEYSDNMSLTLYELMKVFPNLSLPASYGDGIMLVKRLNAIQLSEPQLDNSLNGGRMNYWKVGYIYAKSFFWMRHGDEYVRVPDQLSFSEAEAILRGKPSLRVPPNEWGALEEQYQKQKGTAFFKYQNKIKEYYQSYYQSHSRMLL